jgi:hypothetical protein
MVNINPFAVLDQDEKNLNSTPARKRGDFDYKLTFVFYIRIENSPLIAHVFHFQYMHRREPSFQGSGRRRWENREDCLYSSSSNWGL